MALRFVLLLVAALTLSACGAKSVWAPEDMVQRVAYKHPGPTSISLLTVKNVGSDNGAHTALVINASQRVIWDPAGSFQHKTIAERNDVIFGASPALLALFIDYHTRAEYYTIEQTVQVPPAVAEGLMRRAMARGPISQAMCTRSTVGLLQDTPGFTHLRSSLFPNNLMAQFAKLPGVVTREHRDDDAGKQSAFEKRAITP